MLRSIFLLTLVGGGCSSTTAPSPVSDDGSPPVEADVAATADDVVVTDDVPAANDIATPPTVARATCEVPVGGDVPLLVTTAVEAQPGYDELLEALDVTALPETIDLSGLSTITRSIVAYMLEIDLDALPDTMPRDEIAAIEPMGRAVLLADGDLVLLRRGLHRFYQCARAFPLRLEDFKSAIYEQLARVGKALARHQPLRGAVDAQKRHPAHSRGQSRARLCGGDADRRRRP